MSYHNSLQRVMVTRLGRFFVLPYHVGSKCVVIGSGLPFLPLIDFHAHAMVLLRLFAFVGMHTSVQRAKQENLYLWEEAGKECKKTIL